MGNPVVRADAGRFPHRVAARIAGAKTDLAKYMQVWERQPHIVSLGAQKNFAAFARDVARAWEKSPLVFGEAWFREMVARAIVFRRTERIVSAQPWYGGGYRANIVAYAISRVAHRAGENGRSVDFERIWKAQAPTPAMENALAQAARTAYEVLTKPPQGMRNVTEWAKKPACWHEVKSAGGPLPEAFLNELLSPGERRDDRRTARRDQRQLDGIEAQKAVLEAGGPFWREVARWGRERQLLSPKEIGILRRAGTIPAAVPTEAQVRVLIGTLARLREQHDCPHKMPATG